MRHHVSTRCGSKRKEKGSGSSVSLGGRGVLEKTKKGIFDEFKGVET